MTLPAFGVRWFRWGVAGILLPVLAAGASYWLVFDRDLDRRAAPPRETRTPTLGVPGDSDELLRQVVARARGRVDTLRNRAQYPSVSIAVVHSGSLLWAESLGFADLQHALAATPKSRYPIGSVSKALTAAAAMRLVDTGTLDLDVPVARYLTTLPVHYQKVTMRQLLSHQAGVRHYRLAWQPPLFSESGLNRQFDSVDAGLSIFLADPLLFTPDTDFSYSTYGYSLASRVMEVVAGESFLELMARLVTSPLGLTDTMADRSMPAPAGRTTDYLAPLRGWGVVRSPAANSSYKWAGGGLVSTPTDLAHFGDALVSGTLVGAQALAEMFSPRRLSSGAINEQHYGLGWRTGLMPFPRGSDSMIPIVHHGGTAIGSECLLMLWPDHRLAVSVCGNASTGGSTRLLSLAAGVGADFLDSVASGLGPKAP